MTDAKEAAIEGTTASGIPVASPYEAENDEKRLRTGQPDSQTSSTTDTAEDGIEYVYLDFDTKVATQPRFTGDAPINLPPCPNLTRYTNPFEWPRKRKNVMTWVCCATNSVAAYAAGSYDAARPQLTRKFNISDVKFEIGLTIFVVAFAIGPMFLAPFSEINGRRPVFIGTGLLFIVCQVGSALTDSFGGMLASRFFAGIGGSTFSTMVAGILADIWIASERNTPMVLFTGATLLGTGLGPLVSGFVGQRLLWRWIFYIQIIVSSFFVALITLLFKETRGPIVLARKAKALNQWFEKLEQLGAVGVIETGHTDESVKCRRIRYKVLAEEQRASVWKMISTSLKRAAKLLVTEPVVICFTLWLGLAWGVLYLTFGAVPLVFATNHNFNLEQTGAVFTAICVAAIISTPLSIYQDKWAIHRFGKKFTQNPEGRLWFTVGEGLLFPIGLFWFGWTCYGSIPWIVPTIGLVLVTMGIYSIFLATMNYIADCYVVYASSALAAIGLCRNLLAGVFPLVDVQMYNNMGFQAASSMLGAIGLVLSLGPLLLIWYGPKIRGKSKVASQFMSKS